MWYIDVFLQNGTIRILKSNLEKIQSIEENSGDGQVCEPCQWSAWCVDQGLSSDGCLYFSLSQLLLSIFILFAYLFLNLFIF